MRETSTDANYTAAANGTTVTNSYTPESVPVTVTKVWSDSNNQDGKRPASVTFQLVKTVSGTTSDVTGKTITLNADNKDASDSNKWTGSFTDLPKYEDGKEITYSVRETSTDANYTAAASGTTVTNTLKSYECQIVKKDSSGKNYVPKALLTVTDASGRIYDTWYSEKTPHKLNLPAEEYTLTELKAPSGYKLAAPIQFTVGADGKITSDALKDGVLVMKDSRKPETPTPTPTPTPGTPKTPKAFVVPNTADKNQ